MISLITYILFSNMDYSIIIDILSIIITSLLSIIAIIISVITLIQNNKMIFESSKPNITIFSKVINFTSPQTYLILKNFGTSGATILNIEYDSEIDGLFSKKPFINLQNVYIAPNQSFLYPLSLSKTKEYILDKTLKFKINYKYLNKTYSENCNVAFNIYKDICYLKTHTSKNIDFKELSEVLQEMTIQNL